MGERLNRNPLELGGFAVDLELLCDPELECDCAGDYGCTAVPDSSVPTAAPLSVAPFLAGVFFGTRS